MTKSSRQKDKLLGRPGWWTSNEKCEECGSALVQTGRNSYICNGCGLIQERIKSRTLKKAKYRSSKPLSKPQDDGESLCPDCKQVFSTKKVLELHFKYTGHGPHWFKCPDCSKKFATPEALKNHQRSKGH